MDFAMVDGGWCVMRYNTVVHLGRHGRGEMGAQWSAVVGVAGWGTVQHLCTCAPV